ncbi:ABC transporter permease subunit [Candidatus Uabimicrobium sp. HlEnr_7]|uniref:ABC transporter permease subunit n=1 Tax=Candidatus Uabimicrobium helgolandensis TaxID=3095367 RepID=UPI003558E5EB
MPAIFVIFQRDLRRITFEKKFYLHRVFFVGSIFILFLLFALNSQNTGSNTAIGYYLLSFVSWTTGALLVLTASGTAARGISQEIENKTLELLVITRLSYRYVVFGKFIQQLFITCLNAIAPLPIFLFCVSLGGVSATQVLFILLSLFSLLLITTSIGIFCSVCFTSKQCESMASFFVIIYCIVTLFAPISMSCGYSLYYVLQGFSFNYCIENFLWQCLFSMLLLFLSIYILPYMYLARNKVGLGAKVNKVVDKVTMIPRKKVKGKVVGKEITGNPVAWRDYYMMYRGRGAFQTIFTLVIGGFVAFNVVVERHNHSSEVLVSLSAICLLLFALSLINNSTATFAKAMEHKSWRILLMTKLSNKEIVVGKAQAAIRHSALFFILSAVSFGFFLIMNKKSGDMKDLLVLLSFAFWFTAYVTNLFCCGLFCSFYYKKYRRASNYFVLYVLLWHILSGFIFTSGQSGMLWKGATGFTVNCIFAILHFAIAKAFFDYIVRNLRLRIDFAD